MSLTFDNIDLGKYKEEYLDCNPEVVNQGHGITHSEGLLIYTLAREFEIDILLESGVMHGQSTEIWGKTLPDVKVYGVDNLGDFQCPDMDKVKSRLDRYKNIELIYPADGCDEIPKLISKHSDKKIGVFVDGPKAEKGEQLYAKALDNDNVCFACMHDWTSTNNKKSLATRTRKEWREVADDIDKRNNVKSKYQKKPNGPGLYCTIK